MRVVVLQSSEDYGCAMISGKLLLFIKRVVNWLGGHVQASWYPLLLGLLAAIDNLILFIPVDAILISSSMLRTQKWFSFAISSALGSALGGLFLAALVQVYGLPILNELLPGLTQNASWVWMVHFFEIYGLLLVFLVLASPFFQQPPIVIAALAGVPLGKLLFIIFGARFVKYMLMSYLASHAPKYLERMWGVRRELQEAGIEDLPLS